MPIQFATIVHFRADTEFEDQVEDAYRILSTLLRTETQFPGVAHRKCAFQYPKSNSLSQAPTTADNQLVFVLEFADREKFTGYMAHPKGHCVLEDLVNDITGGMSVSYEFDTGRRAQAKL